MEKPVGIILIDDDEPTNYLHELIIEESNCTDEVMTFASAEKALEYFESRRIESFFSHQLIFLDINMPRMDGWEFLERFEKLGKSNLGNYKIIMLTTSVNPDDKQKATQHFNVSGFYNKPLTEELLEKLMGCNEN